MAKERTSPISLPDLVQTKSSEDIVKIISTELPDIDDDPEIFETIKTEMTYIELLIQIHPVCINTDSPCIQFTCMH